MVEQAELRAFAVEFVSFLIRELKGRTRLIDDIILYGSVASGIATMESDVDIFVNTKKIPAPELEHLLDKFYASKTAALFRLTGIENEISLKAGELKKWKDLHRSISSTGIVLWGNYESKVRPVGAKRKIIFYWSAIRRNRTAFLNKLYGFSTREKRYKGLIEEWDGKKLGKGCVMIPIKHRENMADLAKKYGVDLRAVDALVLQ